MKNPGFLIGMGVGIILIYLLFATFGMQDLGVVFGLVMSPIMACPDV